MEIKLKARLSAYSRFPKVASNDGPSDSDCDAEVVTKEDIDSLFDTMTPVTTNNRTVQLLQNVVLKLFLLLILIHYLINKEVVHYV